MIKASIQEDDITIVNIYAPKYRSTSIHKTNTNRREIDSNTIIVGDLKTSLTPIDRSSK